MIKKSLFAYYIHLVIIGIVFSTALIGFSSSIEVYQDQIIYNLENSNYYGNSIAIFGSMESSIHYLSLSDFDTRITDILNSHNSQNNWYWYNFFLTPQEIIHVRFGNTTIQSPQIKFLSNEKWDLLSSILNTDSEILAFENQIPSLETYKSINLDIYQRDTNKFIENLNLSISTVNNQLNGTIFDDLLFDFPEPFYLMQSGNLKFGDITTRGYRLNGKINLNEQPFFDKIIPKALADNILDPIVEDIIKLGYQGHIEYYSSFYIYENDKMPILIEFMIIIVFLFIFSPVLFTLYFTIKIYQRLYFDEVEKNYKVTKIQDFNYNKLLYTLTIIKSIIFIFAVPSSIYLVQFLFTNFNIILFSYLILSIIFIVFCYDLIIEFKKISLIYFNSDKTQITYEVTNKPRPVPWGFLGIVFSFLIIIQFIFPALQAKSVLILNLLSIFLILFLIIQIGKLLIGVINSQYLKYRTSDNKFLFLLLGRMNFNSNKIRNIFMVNTMLVIVALLVISLPLTVVDNINQEIMWQQGGYVTLDSHEPLNQSVINEFKNIVNIEKFYESIRIEGGSDDIFNGGIQLNFINFTSLMQIGDLFYLNNQLDEIFNSKTTEQWNVGSPIAILSENYPIQLINNDEIEISTLQFNKEIEEMQLKFVKVGTLIDWVGTSRSDTDNSFIILPIEYFYQNDNKFFNFISETYQYSSFDEITQNQIDELIEMAKKYEYISVKFTSSENVTDNFIDLTNLSKGLIISSGIIIMSFYLLLTLEGIKQTNSKMKYYLLQQFSVKEIITLTLIEIFSSSIIANIIGFVVSFFLIKSIILVLVSITGRLGILTFYSSLSFLPLKFLEISIIFLLIQILMIFISYITVSRFISIRREKDR